MSTPATYGNPSGRINRIKGQILKHAVAKEVLSITGENLPMPRNQGDTIVYRRWLPYGAASTNANTMNRPAVSAGAHIVTEGVTPTAESISAVDVSVTIQQYACVYAYTDKTWILHEDDIPEQMKKQVGERMALLREMIKYGVLKGGTNAFYAGGTSRATVSAVPSFNLFSKVARNLQANHSEYITGVLAPSPNYDTSAIEDAYLVFAHTDCAHDIRAMADFVPAAKYGSMKKAHKNEFGSIPGFRFILSPDLPPYADSGAAVATYTTLYSTTGTSADVYPMIVVGENAWGDVALRGSKSFDYTDLKPSQKDKSDLLGQRGYVGASFWSAALVTNHGWMAVVETAITSIS